MTDVPLVTKIFVSSYKYIQIISGCVKTEKSCVFWKMFEMVFKCPELVKIIVFRCFKTNKRVG